MIKNVTGSTVKSNICHMTSCMMYINTQVVCLNMFCSPPYAPASDLGMMVSVYSQ